MSRVLLIDFDGVMLRNPKFSRYQTYHSACYVQRITGMSMQACETLNKQCYPRFGHTVTMLNRLFNINTTLQDYNDYVFDKEKMCSLAKDVDVKTQSEFSSFLKLVKKCNDGNIDTAIFSNADARWIQHCVSMMKPDASTLMSNIITPSTINQLKPHKIAYDIVERRYPHHDEFWFIDDRKENLVEPSSRDNWIPFHYTSASSMTDLEDYFGLL